MPRVTSRSADDPEASLAFHRDGVVERMQARDREVVQEPVTQPYGVRDCAFRDPAENMVCIQEVP
jgi:hypothetical protein